MLFNCGDIYDPRHIQRSPAPSLKFQVFKKKKKLHNIMYVLLLWGLFSQTWLLISLKSGNRVGAVSNSSSKLTSTDKLYFVLIQCCTTELIQCCCEKKKLYPCWIEWVVGYCHLNKKITLRDNLNAFFLFFLNALHKDRIGKNRYRQIVKIK